jgi:hypothetical protein
MYPTALEEALVDKLSTGTENGMRRRYDDESDP